MKKVLIIPFHIDRSIQDAHYLTEGILEEIIDLLSETKGLSVASRNLSLYLKNNPKSGLELSKEFGVSYLLEGSLKIKEGGYQLSMRLIDASVEEVLSIQKTSLLLEQWPQQVHILLPQLFDENHAFKTAHKEVPAVNDARELYLKGRYHWNRYSYEEMKKAIVYFNKALKVDSTYALAYAGLADCYSVIAVMGHEVPLPAFSKALSYVSKALSLGQQHSDIYICAAFLSLFYEKDYAKAKANLDQAMRLNSSNATTYHLLSYYYSFVQQFQVSEKYCIKTLELDPLSIPSYNMLIRLALYKRDFTKAREITEAALLIEPTATPILELKALNYLFTGNLESALETFHSCLQQAPSQLTFYGYLSYTYSKGQLHTESLTIEQRLEQTTETKNTGNYDYAKAIIKLGRKDYKGFFNHVNKAMDVGLTFLVGDIRTNPIYSEIRKDKRYDAFLVRANLHQYEEGKLKQQRPSSQLTLTSNTKETVTLDPQDIAYVQGEGNYCTLYWHHNQVLTHKILRTTLKQLETQLQHCDYLQRCHKSFIVNIDEPLQLSGNARGHFLESNYFPIRIPVSRAKSAEVKTLLKVE